MLTLPNLGFFEPPPTASAETIELQETTENFAAILGGISVLMQKAETALETLPSAERLAEQTPRAADPFAHSLAGFHAAETFAPPAAPTAETLLGRNYAATLETSAPPAFGKLDADRLPPLAVTGAPETAAARESRPFVFVAPVVAGLDESSAGRAPEHAAAPLAAAPSPKNDWPSAALRSGLDRLVEHDAERRVEILETPAPTAAIEATEPIPVIVDVLTLAPDGQKISPVAPRVDAATESPVKTMPVATPDAGPDAAPVKSASAPVATETETPPVKAAPETPPVAAVEAAPVKTAAPLFQAETGVSEKEYWGAKRSGLAEPEFARRRAKPLPSTEVPIDPPVKTTKPDSAETPPIIVMPERESQTPPIIVMPPVEQQTPPIIVMPEAQTENQTPPIIVHPEIENQTPPIIVHPEIENQTPPIIVTATKEKPSKTTTKPDVESPRKPLVEQQTPPIIVMPEVENQTPPIIVPPENQTPINPKHQTPPVVIAPPPGPSAPPFPRRVKDPNQFELPTEASERAVAATDKRFVEPAAPPVAEQAKYAFPGEFPRLVRVIRQNAGRAPEAAPLAPEVAPVKAESAPVAPPSETVGAPPSAPVAPSLRLVKELPVERGLAPVKPTVAVSAPTVAAKATNRTADIAFETETPAAPATTAASEPVTAPVAPKAAFEKTERNDARFDAALDAVVANDRPATVKPVAEVETAKVRLDQTDVAGQIEPRLVELAGAVERKEDKKIMRMRLHPAELGTVEVRLERGADGRLEAHFRTETDAASRSLTQGLERLRDALQESGWQVARLDVSTGTGGSNGQPNQSQAERSAFRQEYFAARDERESAAQPADERDGAARLVNLRA